MHDLKSDKDLQAGDGADMRRAGGNWGTGSPVAEGISESAPTEPSADEARAP